MQCQISRFEMSKQMVSVCMCRKSRHKPIVIIDDGTIQKICVSLEYFYSKDYIKQNSNNLFVVSWLLERFFQLGLGER